MARRRQRSRRRSWGHANPPDSGLRREKKIKKGLKS